MLSQRVGARNIGSVDVLKVVFKSDAVSFTKTRERLLRTGTATEKDIDQYVIGKYFIDSDSVEFNTGYDDMRSLGIDPDELVLHELIHMVQDMADKYPDMKGNIISKGHDIESPWEKEAYRLQKQLLPDFKSYCSWDEPLDWHAAV